MKTGVSLRGGDNDSFLAGSGILAIPSKQLFRRKKAMSNTHRQMVAPQILPPKKPFQTTPLYGDHAEFGKARS